MTLLTNQTWEKNLLKLAYAGPAAGSRPVGAQPDPTMLRSAYEVCEQITARHSKSFYAATSLLPAEKRRAIRALYAFCRVSDDIVDHPEGSAASRLAAWRNRVLSMHPSPADPVLMAWTDARLRYNIPARYVEQLLDGVSCDLRQDRYETFAELAAYAYGVASTVGLMSMYIIGFAGAQALPYAIKLGVALQVTNILRDVGEDWRMGRVYLPQEELAAFNLDETDLSLGRVDDRWRKFMRFQIARNRQLYAEACPGIRMLDKGGRCAVGAAAEYYQAILGDIERHDYDVFTRRAHVSAWDKVRRIPGLWLRYR